MTQAYFRAPSIGRMWSPRTLCEAARSAAADFPCLGSGSTAKTLVRPCFRRLSVAGGTARARWLWQLAAVCWAAMLPGMGVEAGRALGPMLPTSARERWPFFPARGSCHAALPAGSATFCHKLPQDAGLVALATTHTLSDLRIDGCFNDVACTPGVDGWCEAAAKGRTRCQKGQERQGERRAGGAPKQGPTQIYQPSWACFDTNSTPSRFPSSTSTT
eukprot:COSAG02_NODE_1853_length_10660_cov_23.960231_6_plen_217_part_00